MDDVVKAGLEVIGEFLQSYIKDEKIDLIAKSKKNDPLK
jgi:hypothetical protein